MRTALTSLGHFWPDDSSVGATQISPWEGADGSWHTVHIFRTGGRNYHINRKPKPTRWTCKLHILRIRLHFIALKVEEFETTQNVCGVLCVCWDYKRDWSHLTQTQSPWKWENTTTWKCSDSVSEEKMENAHVLRHCFCVCTPKLKEVLLLTCMNKWTRTIKASQECHDSHSIFTWDLVVESHPKNKTLSSQRNVMAS